MADEDEFAVAEDDDDDEDVVMSGQTQGGQGGAEEEQEVVHLQEIVEGLWVGDLVAAMDTEGLEEKGIVSWPSKLTCKRLECPNRTDEYSRTFSRSCVPRSASSPTSLYFLSRLTILRIPTS